MTKKTLTTLRSVDSSQKCVKASKRTSSGYIGLCKRARCILAGMMDEIYNISVTPQSEAGASEAYRRLFGEKESALSAATKTVGLLAKLADTERAIKADADAKKKGRSADDADQDDDMNADDIVMLKRFLERFPDA